MRHTFQSIPIYVSDEKTRYFLFDILLPHEYDEASILLVSRLLIQLRNDCNNDRHEINRMVAQFLESLPFFSFNYFFFQQPQEDVVRYSDIGITSLHIGDKTFSVSTKENDECIVCMTLMKVYLNGTHD